MKILRKINITQLENETKLLNNLTDSELIDEAANAFVAQFTEIVPDTNSNILILCGNGKNGADGLSTANLLSRSGYTVKICVIYVSGSDSEYFIEKLNGLYQSIPISRIHLNNFDTISFPYHDILIDAIFGTGLNRQISNPVSELFEHVNNLPSLKIALDIGSGLFADGNFSPSFIIPDYTIGIGTAKLAYFLSDIKDQVGKLILAPISSFKRSLQTMPTDLFWIDMEMVKSILKPLNRLRHKYQCGSALIIGGSYGMAGCMKLAGEAALRTGCGVVHLHVPYGTVDFLQSSLPEAIIHIDDNKYSIGSFELQGRINSIALGPGMGRKNKQSELIESILDQNKELPMVIDADALNILSGWPNWMEKIQCPAILTPHKGEFERLFGRSEHQLDRINLMQEFSIKTGIVVILKGADTAISMPDGKVYFSNTGNCGMATAGSGDVLTGIIGSLLAQGYSIEEAAILGSQIHGTAGNFAADKEGERSILAGDIVRNIGMAYQFFDEFPEYSKE